MSTQARPQDYALAIYELALEAWTRQLEAVHAALQADAALRAALKDGRVSAAERLARLAAALPEPPSDGVRRFLGTLMEAGQIDQLGAIVVELQRLARRRVERKVARITSAVPLTPAEQEAFRSRLARRYGPDLEFEFAVDPALIGGVHLRVGDQVIDGSVAGKLAALRDRLAA